MLKVTLIKGGIGTLSSVSNVKGDSQGRSGISSSLSNVKGDSKGTNLVGLIDWEWNGRLLTWFTVTDGCLQSSDMLVPDVVLCN